MLKFNVSPSVRAAAIPTGTGFGAFGGMFRHCDKFKKVDGKNGPVLRCVEFVEGAGQPKCDARLKGKIGRSPGLVRAGYCSGANLVKSNPLKKAAKAAKKAPAKKAPAKKKAAKRSKKK
jgi:hypothetical protein